MQPRTTLRALSGCWRAELTLSRLLFDHSAVPSISGSCFRQWWPQERPSGHFSPSLEPQPLDGREQSSPTGELLLLPSAAFWVRSVFRGLCESCRALSALGGGSSRAGTVMDGSPSTHRPHIQPQQEREAAWGWEFPSGEAPGPLWKRSCSRAGQALLLLSARNSE